MTDTIGPHRPDDPRGWLLFDGLPEAMQNAEDATLGADHQRRDEFSTGFNRPATPTERQLLQHLGYTVPDQLTTSVRWLSNGVRNRRWPELENGVTP